MKEDSKKEIDIASLSHMELLIDLDDKSEHRVVFGENASLLINAIALIVSGVCQFHFKLTKMKDPTQYEEYSFCFWRYLFAALTNYLVMLYTNSSLIDFSKLKSNAWFWVRTIDQFFVFETYLFVLCFFRTSTATCFVSMSPVMILILSSFFLGEKFRMRYIYGICICFIGVLFIVSNEGLRKSTPSITPDTNKQNNSNEPHSGLWIIMMGSFWGFIQLLTTALHRVSSKILLSDKIDEDTQIMYTSYVNCIMSLIVLFFFGIRLSTGIGFILNCALNGALWVLFTRLLILSLKGLDLSKTIVVGYLSVITVFILGALFLGERVYLTDIFGSLLIMSFNVYNAMNPPKN